MAGVKTFTPIRQRRSPELVFQQIVEAILDGTYKAGDRLPAEKDLAVQFHVSRGVIREALRMLEQSGLVIVMESAGGGGYGPPAERDRARVLDDLLDGKISVEQARQVYGLALDPGQGAPAAGRS